MKFLWFLIFLVPALFSTAAEPPMVLENTQLLLRFDGQTGNWTGLTDRRTGEELSVGETGQASVAPPRVPKLDTAEIEKAIVEKRALSMAGDWLYTPAPPSKDQSAGFPEGRFEGTTWASTPVPSRSGVGDNRLRNRVGDFWYRREFTVPADWRNADLVLELGSVDDFDELWLNGKRIGHTGAETSHHWETPRYYRFPGSLCRPTGQQNLLLIKVTNGAFDGGINGPVVIGPAASLPAPKPDQAPLSRHVLDRIAGASRLQLSAADGPIEYSEEFLLPDDQATFTRQFTVKNISAKELPFHVLRSNTPVLSAGTGQSIVFPGSLPVGNVPVASLSPDETIRPRSNDPLAVLWDESKQRGLGTWFHSEEEYSPVSIRRNGPGVEICHTQNITIRLASGEAVTLGKQFFWLAHGSRDSVLSGVQEIYREIGLRAPANALPGLRGMVMYCGHPGGPPELGFLHYGGFQALERYVPTLKKMQIDLLWLLPTWEHGDGKRWNLYAPFDHFQVDHLQGTADDLKALSRTSAASGVRLMFDLVPHGPPDFTPLAKAHPEWIARKQDGTNQIAWGQFAFDNHHPGWQDSMRKAAEWGAKEFGAIGARVDCGAGGPLNWNPDMGNRPSLSSLAGGLGMNRAIREGYERVHQQAVLLPEEYTGANIFYRVADLTYDAQFYFLQMDLQERKASPGEWAATLQQFLHDQQETLPPGALKMRWISNHDTVSWTFQKMRPAKAYGVGRMRALLALCAFIEGIPMLYQGDEDPAVYGGAGESNVDFLARIYGLRKELPALRDGIADYHSVRASDGVFACLRNKDSQTALVLISLNPDPVKTAITLPTGMSGAWTDRLAGESVSLGPAIAMQPFQVRVLVQ